MSRTVAKLIALYDVPVRDRALFDEQFFETQVPLVKKIPGLRGLELHRAPAHLAGRGGHYYLISTLIFDDMDALSAALASREGQEAGLHAMSFASNYMTLLTSETEVLEGAALRS